MRILLICALIALGLGRAFGGVEADHLKLYASFDNGPNPEIARDGWRLSCDVKTAAVPGRFGKAVHFDRKNGSKAVVYRTDKPIGEDGWTLAMWLNMDEPGDTHYAEQDFSRGVFGTNDNNSDKGTISQRFTCWIEFLMDQVPPRSGRGTRTMIGSEAVGCKQWTHVAWVFRPNGTNDIYIDGNPVSYSEHNAAAKLMPLEMIRLGNVWDWDRLDGGMDEVKILDKALTGEEVKEVMLSLPLRKTADIDLFLPCDGEIVGRGFDTFSSVGVVYDKGKDDEGVKIIRHGYDRRAILSVGGVMAGRPAQSAFVWFAPDWRADETRETRHGLWVIGDAAFSHCLEKNAGGLVYTVFSAGRKAQLVLKDVRWKNGVFAKVAAGYDFGRNEMYVSVDSRRITGQLGIPSPKAVARASVSVGDVQDADYYSKTQAEGTLDEILVVNGYLDVDTLEEVVETEIAKKVKRSVPTIVLKPVTEQEANLWNLSPAERRKTPTGESITLNALWRCQLTDGGCAFKTGDWNYFPVPGRYAGAECGMSDAEFYFRDKSLKRADQFVYAGKETWRYTQAWFERAFRADPTWKEKVLRLKVCELSSSESGQLFFNGKLLGQIAPGRLDTTFELPEHLVRFGDWNFLTLHSVNSGGRWTWRGVRGDVVLDVCAPVCGEAPEVVTSVAVGKLSTSLRVVNLSARSKTVTLEAEVLGAERPLTLKSDCADVKPGGSAMLSAMSPFRTEKLWDIDSPNLLTCVFRIKDAEGRLLDELPPVRFGVREFATKGRDFYLNGKKIHLFIHDEWLNASNMEEVRKTARLFKTLGFNAIRMSFASDNQEVWNILRVCDEEGILFLPNAIGVSGTSYARWNNPKTREDLTEVMRTRIERWRNHACVVMWYLSVNFLGYPWDCHPLKIADGYTNPEKSEKAKVCLEGAEILKCFDGSKRPYFFQAGGSFGPIHTSNAYFCWWPQTEREAWPEEWSKTGTKPLIPIETGFPYIMSFWGMDILNRTEHPLFYYENLARYYGPSAYALDDDEVAHEVAKSCTGSSSSLWYDALGFQRLKTDLLVGTLSRWRGFDISGICPFAEVSYAYGRNCPRHAQWSSVRTEMPERDHRCFGWTRDVLRTPYQNDVNADLPLPAGAALAKAQAPQLAFFDGGECEPVDRQRNYASGERLQKRLVLINDKRHAVTFRGRWTLGEAMRSFEHRIEPGGKVTVPVDVTVPAVDHKTRLMLTADVSGEGELPVDSLEVRVWPKAKSVDIGAVDLYDPVGLTAAKFRERGIVYSIVGGNSQLRAPLLVVGTEAFDDGFFVWAAKVGLAKRLKAGKVRVLVMAQKPVELAKLGLRTMPVYARTAYDSRGREVGYWAGSGLLAPEKPAPDPQTELRMPEQFFHWNNANIVCSYPILRPSEGQHEVLFACGKDLVYAPVLEMSSGRGAVIFCQFEIERRSQADAEADAMLLALVRHAAAWRPKAAVAAEIVGADRAAEFGVITSVTNISRLAVAKAGEAAFPMFSARDGYLRHPVSTVVFAGKDVVPLTEPAIAAMKTVKGKRIVFYAAPEAPCAQERACADKASSGADSSAYSWAADVVENRFRSIGFALDRFVGKPATNILGERLEKPLGTVGGKAWPYSYNTSTYHSEKHIRW